jgi:hypothetical protein
MLAGDSCHMRHLKGGGPVSPKPRQSPTFFANFYEKALFVKTDVAVALCGRTQRL